MAPLRITFEGGNRPLRQKLLRQIEKRLLFDGVSTSTDAETTLTLHDPVELYNTMEPRR